MRRFILKLMILGSLAVAAWWPIADRHLRGPGIVTHLVIPLGLALVALLVWRTLRSLLTALLCAAAIAALGLLLSGLLGDRVRFPRVRGEEPARGAVAASPGAPAADGWTVPELHAIVLGIVRRVDLLETRTGTWEHDGAVSSWRAEIGPSGPEYIEERLGLGDRGLSLIRYYFVAGSLILYQEEGERPAPAGDREGPPRRPIDRTIFFCPSGRIVSARGHLDGVDEPPDQETIAAARTRAAALLARAPGGHLVHPAREPGAPPPPDLMRPAGRIDAGRGRTP